MLKPIAVALVLALMTGAPAHAEEQVLEEMDTGQVGFVMPSGNIGCLFTPEGGTDVYMPENGGPELICERVEPSYVTVVLGGEGEATVIENPGEQSCCGAENILAYGNEVELDGFYCESATTGLTCENANGYGFTMARAGIETFYMPDDESDDDDDDETEGD